MPRSTGIRSGSTERRELREQESNLRPLGYEPSELPTAPSRDFSGPSTPLCFTSCIHPIMPTSFVWLRPWAPPVSICSPSRFSSALSENISRKKKDSNLRYALTYATLAMWCFRPLSHSSVLPPCSRLSPV